MGAVFSHPSSIERRSQMNAPKHAARRTMDRAKWNGSQLARKIEQALFAVTLASMAYLWLGPLVVNTWA